LRDAYPEVQDAGGEVVAIGTGNPSMARGFIEDYRIPYPVLIDADAHAAKIMSIVRIPFWKMFHPASYGGTARAWRAGHRIGGSGKRVDQLGSTFVVGPVQVSRSEPQASEGQQVELLYEHRDAHSADHAPLSEVLAALRR
jgi:AhpC/TSA antioxidant enzyme